MKASNILNEITERTRRRMAERENEKPLEVMRKEAEAACAERAGSGNRSFYEALKEEGMSYICEVKKASPSKGLIAPDFPYLDIALEYEAAGAAAVSCLTEPYYFMGSDEYLREIAAAVDLPVLRKDFTVNE